MEIKRGYVKWEDENGFHKEPLADHADMLTNATPLEKLRAEEVRRLNAAAEEFVEDQKEEGDKTAEELLAELKKAPDEVHTAAQLTEEAPVSAAAEEPTSKEESKLPSDEPLDADHYEALLRLREETASQ